MSTKIGEIALDLDGGDYAPKAIAKGLDLAIKEGWVKPEQIVVLGSPESITWFNQHNTHDISCQECGPPIAMGDDLTSIRKSRRSSIAQGVFGVKEGKFQAFVSAGETKAMVIWSTLLLVDRTEKLDLRPAIAVKMPHVNGVWLLVDAGANLEAKSVVNLLHNAQMGAIYANQVMGIANPRIGLINIGQEPSKGDQTVKDAFKILSMSSLNFVGNVEARDLFLGKVDVGVCEGWDGNLILKTGEGLVEMFKIIGKREVKRLISRPKFSSLGKKMLYYSAWPFIWLLLILAAPFLWLTFQDLKRKISYEEIGGALLLGVPGIIICHGRSNAKAIANALRVANQEISHDVHRLISAQFLENQKSP